MEKVEEKDVLINRTQMLEIAQEYNIFVSQGTIHRWANEPNFPLAVGKEGKFILYSKMEFTEYLENKVRNIQIAH